MSHLGVVYSAQGIQEEAADDFQRVIELDLLNMRGQTSIWGLF